MILMNELAFQLNPILFAYILAATLSHSAEENLENIFIKERNERVHD